MGKVTLDGLLETLEAAERAISDLTLEYDMSVEYADMAAKIEQARTPGHEIFLVNGPLQCQLSAMRPFSGFYRHRASGKWDDTRGNTGSDDRVAACNGRVFKTYHACEIAGLPGRLYQEGTITGLSSGPETKPTCCGGCVGKLNINITPVGYMACFSMEDFEGRIVNIPEYLRLVRDTSKTDRLEFKTEIQRVNDCSPISVWHWRRVKRNDNGNEIDLLIARYYFSVDHGLSLVRKEGMKGGDVGSRQDILRFERLSNGTWFPTDCSYRDLEPDGVANVFKVTRVAVNQGLTEKDFDLSFPPGTKVDDGVTGKTYIVKPAQGQ